MRNFSLFKQQSNEIVWTPASKDFQLYLEQDPIEIVLGYEVDGLLKQSSFLISGQYLIEIDSLKIPIRYLGLYLSTFEAFQDSLPEKEEFGFYLNSEIYFTRTQADLDHCYKIFSKICILTNIEYDFVFIKEIDKGSTATVFLCESITSHKKFAVKSIKKSGIKPQTVQNLGREIQILRSIEHQNICKLYYVYENTENVYLVLEYLPHGNLLTRLSQRKKFSEQDCKVLIKNLLITLDYMHCRDIVHRDLKLENILMVGENDTEFKLVDLGLAYDSHFLQNKKCGSPGYVAPEILREEDYDCKIDIFSSGVVLYILLHGYHPFRARNTKNLLYKNMECEIKISKHVSEIVSDVLLLMMEPYQELRPSASRMLGHPWFSAKMQNICTFPTNQSSNYSNKH